VSPQAAFRGAHPSQSPASRPATNPPARWRQTRHGGFRVPGWPAPVVRRPSPGRRSAPLRGGPSSAGARGVEGWRGARRAHGALVGAGDAPAPDRTACRDRLRGRCLGEGPGTLGEVEIPPVPVGGGLRRCGDDASCQVSRFEMMPARSILDVVDGLGGLDLSRGEAAGLAQGAKTNRLRSANLGGGSTQPWAHDRVLRLAAWIGSVPVRAR
jgi:hypothetical protein